ncbi:MAG: carboxymuconolactone decarboxylase family protein, partial [Acidobacteriota bacterium]
EAMVALAAAFAVNCTTSVEEHIGAARSAGVTDEEIDSILRMAGLVRGKAVSHVERIAERVRKGVAPGESTAE